MWLLLCKVTSALHCRPINLKETKIVNARHTLYCISYRKCYFQWKYVKCYMSEAAWLHKAGTFLVRDNNRPKTELYINAIFLNSLWLHTVASHTSLQHIHASDSFDYNFEDGSMALHTTRSLCLVGSVQNPGSSWLRSRQGGLSLEFFSQGREEYPYMQ